MRRLVLVVGAAAVAVVAGGGQDKPAAPGGPADEIKKLAAEYVRAFNAGDAKAAAAAFTADAEYTGPDGETTRGRAAVEADLADLFKTHPKATIEFTTDAARLIGPNAAAAEGVVKVKLSGQPNPVQSRYAAVFVRGDDGWRVASVTETAVDAATDVTPKDLGWLVGEWAAKGDGGELHVAYEWDEAKVFLRGKYALTRDGKPAATGTQIIGRNPAGGLRSWHFDSSGAVGEQLWSRDGDRWVTDAVGTTPDGTEVTGTNVLIPLGPDAFTWQSIDREAGGEALPDAPPVKVTRVKK